MTQESPLVICNRCRTPTSHPAGQVHGEFYCEDCLPIVVHETHPDT
jgi:late competence protein required for DNA uptake (superfamily II DNA/RNA helicase)